MTDLIYLVATYTHVWIPTAVCILAGGVAYLVSFAYDEWRKP